MELTRLISPARQGQGKGEVLLEQERERLSRPLSKEERKRALAVLEAAERLENELEPLGEEQSRLDSSELLHESREERTRQLA